MVSAGFWITGGKAFEIAEFFFARRGSACECVMVVESDRGIGEFFGEAVIGVLDRCEECVESCVVFFGAGDVSGIAWHGVLTGVARFCACFDEVSEPADLHAAEVLPGFVR